MTYLIIGESGLIAKEIEDLLKKYNTTSIIKYDLENISIKEAIDDINTINLFSDLKVIICSNFNKIDKDELLIKYLDNQNDNILILTDINKIDERKSISKKLHEKAKIIDLSEIDLIKYIKDSFNDYEISNLTINLLNDYCNNDYNRLKEEIIKLKMYKIDEKEITDDDVKKLVRKSFDKNIFDLIDSINKHDKKTIFNIYYQLLDNNDDELRIMGVLANNFRLLYKIKELISDYDDNTCIKMIGIHPYRFKLLKNISYNYDKKTLLKYLQDLSNIDISIKNGNIDKKISMELFLAKI